MDTLPVELLRLIFGYCDASTARKLRLVSRAFADMGYDYMLPAQYTVDGWKDDIKKLHALALHQRLRNRIQSVTFDFSDNLPAPEMSPPEIPSPESELDDLDCCPAVDESKRRPDRPLLHYLDEPDSRQFVFSESRCRNYRRHHLRPGTTQFDLHGNLLRECFRCLASLTSLTVTYSKRRLQPDLPNRPLLDFSVWRKMDRDQACMDLSAIVAAMEHAKITSLKIDRVPLEVLRTSESRRLWFQYGPVSFANLQRLDLTLDAVNHIYPAFRMRTVNGLGRVLQFCKRLTHLSLAFRCERSPREKFMLSLRTLLECFAFDQLTDLRLEGISTVELDLRTILRRHGPTLERLRLKGIHLSNGTFEAMFKALRGKMPALQRFHMEGDFEAADALGAAREMYNFHAVTDDNWEPVAEPSWVRGDKETIDCLEFERYLLRGGEYPQPVPSSPQHN